MGPFDQNRRRRPVVRSSTGDGKIPFIHSDDIADVAAEALTMPEYEGRVLSITGPEALSYAEMTAKIGAGIGKALDYQAVSDEEARRQQGAWGAEAAMVANSRLPGSSGLGRPW